MLRMAPVLSLVLVVVAAACATPVSPRGNLPAHPTDEQLANDGTPEEREALRRRYAITLDGEKVRVGDAVRGTRGGLLGTQVNGDLADFAGDAADGSGVMKRTAMILGGAGVQAASVVFLMVMAPIPVVGALGSVSALEILGTTAVALPLARRHGVAVQVFAAIHATLFVAWLVGMILLPVFITQAVSVVLLEQARRSTNDAAWTTVDNYNRKLNHRIRDLGAAPVTEPAPAETPTAPAAPAEAP